MTDNTLESTDAGGAWTPYRAVLSDRTTALVLAVTFVGVLSNVLPAALPGIATALGVADDRAGLLISAYQLPSVVIIPIVAGVSDLYGRRTALIPSIMLFGAAGVGMYWAPGFPSLLALALVLGVGGAAIVPLTVTILADLYRGARNSTAQGLRVGVIGLAALTVPAAAGYAAEIAWNVPFLLFGLAIPVGLLAAARLAETVDIDPTSSVGGPAGTDARTETDDTDPDADGGLGAGASADPEPDPTPRSIRSRITGYAAAVRVELRDRTLAILLAGGVVRGFVMYGVVTFVPLFAVRRLDASLFAAGALLSLRGVGYLTVSPLAGIVVARAGRRSALAVAMGAIGAALVAIPAAPTPLALGLPVLLFTLGDALLDPVLKDAVSSSARPSYRAGVVNALYLLKRFAQAASPAALGVVLAVAGFGTLFRLVGLIALCYLAAFIVLVAPTDVRFAADPG